MFILPPPKQVSWADRTMTVLRRNRMQACERELTGLPQHSLFDASVTDVEAEVFFAGSWYAKEEKQPALHSIEGLRSRVLQDLPISMCLLTPEEHDLMVRAVLLRGHLPLVHPESFFPALSIARRLWAVLDRSGPVPRLEFPAQICFSAMLTLANEGYRNQYDRFTRIYETVDNTLYLAGLLNAEIVLQDILQTFLNSPLTERPILSRISLRAGFETCEDRSGRLFLMHPGLADPCILLKNQQPDREFNPISRDAEDLSAAYESLTALEDPLYDRMLSLIQDLCRQEVVPEETVEDLIILIKQGADDVSLREVLSSRLVCLPTFEMESALRELSNRIPRWFSLQMSQIQ